MVESAAGRGPVTFQDEKIFNELASVRVSNRGKASLLYTDANTTAIR
jgi:hypothetical protein